MKFQVVLFLGLSALMASCATSIPYTNEESCATQNQSFLGLEKQEVVTVTHSQAERAPMVREQSFMVTKCEVPKTNADKQEIQNLKAELEPKILFNQTFWKYQADHDRALAAAQNIIASSAHSHMQATFPKDE